MIWLKKPKERTKRGQVMERTLLIIKPDATQRNLLGHVIGRLEKAKYSIVEMKMLRLSKDEVRKFYAVHEGKPFMDDLTDYMASGLIVPLVLEKENAIDDLRILIGATDPAESAPGTIRALYGNSKTENAVHASDSPERVERESSFYFGDCARALNV